MLQVGPKNRSIPWRYEGDMAMRSYNPSLGGWAVAGNRPWLDHSDSSNVLTHGGVTINKHLEV